MPSRSTLVALAACLAVAAPAQAAPSTPSGKISVAQAVELIQRSSTDNAARNATLAYLGGVGETVSLMIAEAGRRQPGAITCARPLGISGEAALAALMRTDQNLWSQTAATPLLVEDMLSRGGCR